MGISSTYFLDPGVEKIRRHGGTLFACSFILEWLLWEGANVT